VSSVEDRNGGGRRRQKRGLKTELSFLREKLGFLKKSAATTFNYGWNTFKINIVNTISIVDTIRTKSTVFIRLY
jgi:hypothetical protein